MDVVSGIPGASSDGKEAETSEMLLRTAGRRLQKKKMAAFGEVTTLMSSRNWGREGFGTRLQQPICSSMALLRPCGVVEEGRGSKTRLHSTGESFSATSIASALTLKPAVKSWRILAMRCQQLLRAGWECAEACSA